MTLITTARLSHRSPAEELGIVDEAIAQAFNIECGLLWDRIEQERESERLAAQFALLTAGVSRTDGPIPATKKFNEQSF